LILIKIISTIRIFIICVFIVGLFSNCNNNGVVGNPDKIELVPLKDFSFSKADLPAGTPLRILGYSGGREIRSKDTVLLYEFLCINLNSKDTVRVFSSLISIDNSESPPEIFTTPHLFNGDKQIYDAVFELIDLEKEKTFLMTMSTSDPKSLEGTVLDQSADSIRRYVVLNHSLPPMLEPTYKCAFGCLHFKQQPW
jgi:hypothetical protein